MSEVAMANQNPEGEESSKPVQLEFTLRSISKQAAIESRFPGNEGSR
jgi:hypothetical protein